MIQYMYRKIEISMLTKNNKKIDQMQIVSLDSLVPREHLLRKIEDVIAFNFIYNLVEEKYLEETDRPKGSYS